MQINRRGVSRIVIVSRKFAFKLPNFVGYRGSRWRLFLTGLLANMQEVEFSRVGWPELCPVVFRLPLGILSVMPRAEVLTDDEFLAFDVKAFCYTDNYVVPAEHKADSFGRLDGRIVAIDYGN